MTLQHGDDDTCDVQHQRRRCEHMLHVHVWHGVCSWWCRNLRLWGSRTCRHSWRQMTSMWWISASDCMMWHFAADNPSTLSCMMHRAGPTARKPSSALLEEFFLALWPGSIRIRSACGIFGFPRLVYSPRYSQGGRQGRRLPSPQWTDITDQLDHSGLQLCHKLQHKRQSTIIMVHTSVMKPVAMAKLNWHVAVWCQQRPEIIKQWKTKMTLQCGDSQ